MLLQTTFFLTGDCSPELVLSLVQIKPSPTHCYRLFIDSVNTRILSFSVKAYPLSPESHKMMLSNNKMRSPVEGCGKDLSGLLPDPLE